MIPVVNYVMWTPENVRPKAGRDTFTLRKAVAVNERGGVLKPPQDPFSVESQINLFSVRFKKKILFDLQISSRKIKVIDFLKANLRNQIGSVGFADTLVTLNTRATPPKFS